MFDLEKNEIKFLYNSNSLQDKEAYGYVLTLHNHKINELDISKNDITPTQFSELAKKMNVRIIDLFDQKSEYFKKNIEGKGIKDEELLAILAKEKSALKTPIFVSEKMVKVIEYPRNIISMDMTFK
jgi:arsenate reductase-like glutaredoxin family protein